jgi:hypothetical protein
MFLIIGLKFAFIACWHLSPARPFVISFVICLKETIYYG